MGGDFALFNSSASDPSTSETLLLNSILTRAEVPILVKLLSAAKPLSVQVHPSAEFAHRGFHDINSQSDPENLPFADEFEKIELLYALTEFEAFAGWRDFTQVRAIFASLSALTNVDFFPTDATQSEAFAHLVHHAPTIAQLSTVIAAIPRALAQSLDAQSLDAQSLDAYATVIAEYPHDPGCLLTLFLDVVHLEPGESIFVPAGVPHSYIRGTGIEVMTSSDNVLRLGLTPKPVFADLALEALRFTPSESKEPFTVRTTHDSLSAESGHYRLILALESETTVQLAASDSESVSPAVSSVIIKPGQAVVITANEPTADISTLGTAAVVTVNHFG
jgi:mannose-6-phosphate isomerase